VIRIVAVGVMCLVGIGAVSPLGRDRAPAPATEVGMPPTYPVVTGNKSDRLPIYTEAVAPEPTVEVDNAPVLMPQIAVVPPLTEPKAERTQPEFIPRHWHDPTASKYKIQKRSAVDTKRPQARPIERPKQVSEARDCSSDGLAPLLRKLNLQPRCE
jgi:hypothetical protein